MKRKNYIKYWCVIIPISLLILCLSGCITMPETGKDKAKKDMVTHGVITEKFREGNQIVVSHYFVINKKYEIRVDVEEYYQYEVGDTYSFE